ncbi:MAG: 30S ribosomal protein S3 [Candidatus Pacebacteria bacterium]|nr:30S ribosomal protein S3 [Candidatus Paceibacterota bacterium]MBP9058467.1 30S ribosomal protein S3 [Candidatus Paceibacterota bacterium]MBP9769943.1 30S ribosomal protein S3 [Candidatus Paceibacterota bacterium]
MSKIVHPYAHRLVILRDWKSRWFAGDKRYQALLKGDIVLREFLNKRLKGFYVAGVEIERSQKTLRIIIRTSRPGMLIGRNGEGSIKLKADVMNLLKRQKLDIPPEVKIDIVEVSNPDADAKIIAHTIIESLEKRTPFRRVMKQVVEKVMSVRGVEGVRIVLSGRLGGAEIARTEDMKKGSIPLQTFRADIDYTTEKAKLPYGDIGIKVWVYKGQVFEKDKDKNKSN